MENLIIGFLVGVVVFGIIWQFFLKNKQAEIDLAKSQVEIKAGEESKQELVDQLNEKKNEVKNDENAKVNFCKRVVEPTAEELKEHLNFIKKSL